jgi:hypothetical protein
MSKLITSLKPNQVFVFGSNGIGAHAGGAAEYAKEHFGAIEGVAQGLVGQSFAIDTMGRKERIKEGADMLRDTAIRLPALTFFLTPVGCGIAGYKAEEIAPYFAQMPTNVVLPEEFKL